jgi:GPH family glycoside/pentoside/hexuronide:cation symporter
MLSFGKKVAYAIPRFGSSFFLTLVGLTSFYIYGSKFDLNWLLAGISLGVSFLVIGFTQWLVGYYSDGLETRYGRRKPFLIIGAPGMAITGFLIFIPNWFINTTDPALELVVFAYYLTTICAFKFFYGFTTTPLQSWLPEITDEKERPVVSGMQNTANWVANGMGVVLGFIAPLLFVATPIPGLSSVGLIAILAFAVIEIIFYIPAIIWVREKKGIVIPKRSLVRETKLVLRNRDYVGWCLAVGFLSLTLNALTTQVVGFAQEVMLLNSITKLLPPALALLFTMFVAFYIWAVILRRFGKRRPLIIAMVVLALLLPLSMVLPAFVSVLPATILTTVYFVPLGVCMAVYYLMTYIVPADITQVDELETGESRAGMYTGFIAVPLNVFQFFSGVALGVVMSASNILTGGDVYGYMVWAPVFAPYLLAAAVILTLINLDPDFKAQKKAAKK